MDNFQKKSYINSENRKQIIDIFCELLEVSTHLILYLTKVYPIDFFEKREKYGTPVVMSRHPQLNGYIYDVIKSLKGYLERDLIENIYILIIDDKNKPIKRFVFSVNDLIQKDYDKELNFKEISLLFSGMIKRLWAAPLDSNITEEDEDLSFQFLVKLKGEGESGDSKENSRFPWILAEDEYLTSNQRKEEENVREGSKRGNKEKDQLDEDDDYFIDNMEMDEENENSLRPPKIFPVYSISNPSIKMQLYIES